MREDLISVRTMILIHLASLRRAGNVYAKTTKGMSVVLDVPAVTVFKHLVPMRQEGLVIAKKEGIDGKYPMTAGHHTPKVYEITQKGLDVLDELREYIMLTKEEK